MTLCGKRDFTDMIKSDIEGDIILGYPGTMTLVRGCRRKRYCDKGRDCRLKMEEAATNQGIPVAT